MQALILLTAMTATGGLFGGGKCGKPAFAPRGHHGRIVGVNTGCGATMAAQAPAYYAPAPTPQVAPAPQQGYYAAPTAPMVSYNSFYSGGAACATGNCPRR